MSDDSQLLTGQGCFLPHWGKNHVADQGPLTVRHVQTLIDNGTWRGIPWVERPKIQSGTATGRPVVGRCMPVQDIWE